MFECADASDHNIMFENRTKKQDQVLFLYKNKSPNSCEFDVFVPNFCDCCCCFSSIF